MKIGFSLGRCVRDIVNGKVEFDDVLVIISRTNIKTVETLQQVIREYRLEPTYLGGLDEDRCQEVAKKIWDAARLHQPRVRGASTKYIPEDYVWMDVVPTSTELPEHISDAWKTYRTMLVLGGNKVPDNDISL